MAEDPGTNGGGGGVITPGGTPASMCAISNADTVGTLGNLLTRIEQLEQIVSQITGANLHASTLGDLSDQVGWVYGIEYMGIPGWIQTEYGTLIPPPGFTISGSGIQMWNACTGQFEDYQAVVMDENGVLQWGATTAGGLCGEAVEAWNESSNNDYYVIAPGSLQSGSRVISLTASTLNTDYKSYTFVVGEGGLYSIGASCVFECNVGIGDSGTADCAIKVTVQSLNYDNAHSQIGNEFYNQLLNAGTNWSGLHILSTGDTVVIEMTMTIRNGTLANRAVDQARVGIVRLTDTA